MSFTSTSSGWLMAKATARANEAVEIDNAAAQPMSKARAARSSASHASASCRPHASPIHGERQSKSDADAPVIRFVLAAER